MKANGCPLHSNVQLSGIKHSSFIMKSHWPLLDLPTLNKMLKNPRLTGKTVTLSDVLDTIQEVNSTQQKMNFSIKNFFNKCDEIRIWSHLLKETLMEKFIF